LFDRLRDKEAAVNSTTTLGLFRKTQLDAVEDMVAGLAGQDLRLSSLSAHDRALLNARLDTILSLLRSFRGTELPDFTG
jgi:hypothetical protein